MIRTKTTALAVPAIIVVILDQLTKHWIRLSPSWHSTDIIPGWLAFHYTQNPGMALGMRWASTEVISIFAIVATMGILTYVLYNRRQASQSYMFCMGLVLGGAFGNIIDRLLMGYIQSTGGVLEGHVIDFIHFNLTVNGYPVFPYIFNVADIAITTAIIAMIVFHNKVMPEGRKSGDLGEEQGSQQETDADQSDDHQLADQQ